ncbi:MAG: winged helix-turn-helix transcriptional regulator [Akkermansiaceae bacterium]|nr:winged helix-turn-helix transcriptional regulator [Akkermansiaceae bacterium]
MGRKLMGRTELDRVSEIFKALSETTRLLILRELKDGTMSVGELVARLDTSQANISKQLKTLHDAGLLERNKSGNTVYYSIKEPMVLDMCKLVCDKLNRDSSADGGIHFEL